MGGDTLDCVGSGPQLAESRGEDAENDRKGNVIGVVLMSCGLVLGLIASARCIGV